MKTHMWDFAYTRVPCNGNERAAKFKGSTAEIRQGVSLLGLSIASSGNLLTFYARVLPTHVCCSATWAFASRLDFHSFVVE